MQVSDRHVRVTATVVVVVVNLSVRDGGGARSPAGARHQHGHVRRQIRDVVAAVMSAAKSVLRQRRCGRAFHFDGELAGRAVSGGDVVTEGDVIRNASGRRQRRRHALGRKG